MHEGNVSNDLQKNVAISQYSKMLSKSLGVEALSTFINLLFEMFDEVNRNPVSERHICLQFTASVYYSGYQPTPFRDPHEGTTMILPDTQFRSLQRFGCKRGALRTGCRPDYIKTKCNTGNNVNEAERSIPLWYGKRLLLLRISLRDAVPGGTETDLRTEFCVLQFYQVVRKQEHSIDGVDGCLNSVRLRWDRAPGEAGNHSVAKKYRIIACDSIRGPSSDHNCRCWYDIDV